MDSKIKVLVIHNTKAFCGTLKNILKKDYIVKCTEEIDKISGFVGNFQPEIIVLGETDKETKEVIKYVKNIFPNSKVLLLHEISKERILEYVRAGADGYIRSNWKSKELKTAISWLFKDSYLYPRKTAGLMADEIRNVYNKDRNIAIINETIKMKFNLNELQMRIYELLAQGFSNKAIADKLGILGNKVKNELFSIYIKIGVKNQREAIAKYYSFLPFFWSN